MGRTRHGAAVRPPDAVLAPAPNNRPSRQKEVVPVAELHIALEVNGERREVDVEPRRLLVQVLREDLNLTGTHVGCDTSQYGACTAYARDLDAPGG
jgi:hypothetical protein